MTAQEFIDLAKIKASDITWDEFRIINEVYTHHPSISETDGKAQVVYLFKTFGMQIFYDMRQTAIKAQELEHKQNEARLLAQEYKRQLDRMRPPKWS